jgi:hypothetical protein
LLLALLSSVAACGLISGASDLRVGDVGGSGGDAKAPAAETSTPDSGPKQDGDGGAEDGGDPPVAVPDGCAPIASGPRFATAAKDGDWFDGAAAFARDGNPVFGDNTDLPLELTGYGFSLPPSATVLGIAVTIRRRAQGNVRDEIVSLSRGVIKAKVPDWSDEGTAYVDERYGGPNDRWGTTWTAADINAATFGVSLKVDGTGSAFVDSMEITVHYCP